MAETMKIKCPVCQTEAEQPLNIAINTRLHPELKQKLLDGTLLLFECEHCGAKRRITSQFMYHDPDKKLLFFVAPNFNEQRDNVLAQLEEFLRTFPFSTEDYQMRIMLETADLMEKVQIFDYGFSDTEVELVKMLTDGLFAQENPEALVKNRYFFINKSSQPKFLYITETDQIMVDCHDKLFEFIRDKFKKVLALPQMGHFLVINHTWANHAIQKKKASSPTSEETEK